MFLYSCVVLISFVIISIDGLVFFLSPQATGMRGRGRGPEDFCCVMIKST